MTYYVGPVLVFLLALTEAAVLPLFRIAGMQPNLVLVLLVAWLILRGPKEAFVFAAVGGVCLGFVDGAPMGTALLALAPLVFLQDVRGSQLREGGLLMTVLFTVIMTLAFHLTYFAVYLLLGQSGSVIEALTRVILPTAFLNVGVLLPIYAVLSLASQQTRRAAYV